MPKPILLIVESGAKCKKIESILGKGYKCKASVGHISGIRKKSGSIDVNNNYKPTYDLDPNKKDVVASLKKEMKSASEVIMAADPDREGEAIAFHVANALGLNPKTVKRVTFSEITADVVKDAVKHPRKIDMDLVYAQQARLVLDYLIGYNINPLLWKHIMMNLSGGRCQSPILKILYDREKNIDKFSSESYYKVIAKFKVSKKLILYTNLSDNIKNKVKVADFLKKSKVATFMISKISDKIHKSNPSAPFETSTFQQECNKLFGMSSKQAMGVAQKLYTSGHITYHRTDSTHISTSFKKKIKAFILDKYGPTYLEERDYNKKSKLSQEAHECIRATDLSMKSPPSKMGADGNKVYQLIWKRTIASQMAATNKKIYTIAITISNIAKYNFVGKIDEVIFDGYQRLYNTSGNTDDDNDNGDSTMNLKNTLAILSYLKLNKPIDYKEISCTEKFTSAVGRYNEGGLIKELKSKGIGRPSTYASFIEILQAKNYVEKKTVEGIDKKYNILSLKSNKIKEETDITQLGREANKLFITDLGNIVVDFLTTYFNDHIMNYGYTCDMEDDLDKIAQGKKKWYNVVDKYYKDIIPIANRVKKMKKLEREKYTKILGKNSNGENIQVRLGKYGMMYQYGDCDKKNKDSKCKFSGLEEGTSLETASLREAKKQLSYPIVIGVYKNKEVLLNNGLYGYYLKHNEKNYTLKSVENADKIKIDEAKKVIKKKEDKIISILSPEIKIMKGTKKKDKQYPPYVMYIGDKYTKVGEEPIPNPNPKSKSKSKPKPLFISLDSKINPETLTLRKTINLINEHIEKKMEPRQTK